MWCSSLKVLDPYEAIRASAAKEMKNKRERGILARIRAFLKGGHNDQ